MNEIGISLYLANSDEINREVLKKAAQAKASYAFTSLNIPEESHLSYQQKVQQMLALCQEYGIPVFLDVNPQSLAKLGCTSFTQLREQGVAFLRLDDGFEPEEIAALSKTFRLVCNASTLKEEECRRLQGLGVDLSRIIACHNFYPKPFTGLSLSQVKAINAKLHQFGCKVMAFAAGDGIRRGPLHQGLPTVEEHRHQDVLQSMLELKQLADCDIVLIGDVDCREETWQKIQHYQEGFVDLECELAPEFAYLDGMLQHDRVDSSEWIIRSVESRTTLKQQEYEFHSCCVQERYEIGDIRMSNLKYQRYCGELDIVRQAMPWEETISVIGKVQKSNCRYLPYIACGFGFRLRRKQL